jgi:hypothetical protein
MAVICLSLLAAKLLFVVLARLSPLLPLPLVLATERWALTKYEFSRVGAMAFQAAYVASVFVSCYVSYLLAMICWTANL